MKKKLAILRNMMIALLNRPVIEINIEKIKKAKNIEKVFKV